MTGLKEFKWWEECSNFAKGYTRVSIGSWPLWLTVKILAMLKLTVNLVPFKLRVKFLRLAFLRLPVKSCTGLLSTGFNVLPFHS